MASDHTENLGLSLWEPGDAFVRAEFNEDNKRIDAAIRAAEDAGRRAAAGLADMGYDLYNLALQHYYDGKQTDFKRAMVFDGFLDGDGIASLSGGLTRGSGVLSLQGNGMGDVELGCGEDGGDSEATSPRTATGSASLRGFTFRIRSDVYYETSPVVDYILTVNGAAAAAGKVNVGTMAGYAAVTKSFTFSPQAVLKRGDVFTLALSASGSAFHFATDGGGGLGGVFRVSSASGQNGRMTGVGHTLPASRGLLGWVRYQGGGLALSVRDGTGAERALAPDGVRETVSLQGVACAEAAFRLDAALPAGESAVLLDAALGGAERMEIYDYGVLWM